MLTFLYDSLRLLSSEFPDLIQKHIRNRLATHQTLFKTFLVLEADNETNTFKLRKRRKYSTNDEPGSSSTPASPTMRRHRIIPPDVSLPNFSRPIKELEAAKKKRDQEAAKTREAAAAARAEEEHFRKAQKQGQTQECGCCCTDYAMDRMINCNNPDPKATHYLCYGCVKTHIETEIGLSRHKIECMHMDGCTSSFSLSVLRKAVPAQSLLKLEKLQQQDDIRLAMEAGGLEDLDECPFCDFKAICPPKEIDREFRCQSDHCGIVSCRLCKLETHIPLSCMEKAAEKGINARHQVEEAMTEALVRSCKYVPVSFLISRTPPYAIYGLVTDACAVSARTNSSRNSAATR